MMQNQFVSNDAENDLRSVDKPDSQTDDRFRWRLGDLYRVVAAHGAHLVGRVACQRRYSLDNFGLKLFSFLSVNVSQDPIAFLL